MNRKLKAVILFISFLILSGCNFAPYEFEFVDMDYSFDYSHNRTNLFLGDYATVKIWGEAISDISLATSGVDTISKTLGYPNLLVISSSNQTTDFVTLDVTFTNGAVIEQEIGINFVDHGIEDFHSIEGIVPTIDKIDKVRELLGAPQTTFSFTYLGISIVTWSYYLKGLQVSYDTSDDTVISVRAHYDFEDNVGFFSPYPYPILSDDTRYYNNTTMDHVISNLTMPTLRITSGSPDYRLYEFTGPQLVLNSYFPTGLKAGYEFQGSSIYDYLGKEILTIYIEKDL